jgi:hypothetical protein
MKIFLSFLTLALLATSASAYTPSAASAYRGDRSDATHFKYHLGSMLQEAHNTAICVYDYTKVGGVVGDIALYQTDAKTLCKLPSKAIIRNGLIDVVTAPTSGGSATIAVKAQSAGDIIAATAKASFTGKLDTVPVGTAATAIKLTAERQIYATVAVSALTAGKFRVFIDYVLSE